MAAGGAFMYLRRCCPFSGPVRAPDLGRRLPGQLESIHKEPAADP